MRWNARVIVNTDVKHLGNLHVASNAASPLPRSLVVWTAFAVACAAAIGMLWIAAPARGVNNLHTSRDRREPAVASIVPVAITSTPRIAPHDKPMARGQWQAIVIYDSGSPAGDVAALERRHLDAGLSGLGYHFVIGNGQGMEDGQVSVGFRWELQLPGAHANAAMCAPWPLRAHEAPLSATDLNRKSVAICLVGNGARRAFTDQQTRQLLNLVRSLQAELGIGAHGVFFRQELAPNAGRLGESGQFQPGTFRAQLLP